MAYYPKNKILTNQIATPNMIGADGLSFNYVVISTKQYYQGDYYTLYNGKTYTGKYPGDGDNQELIKEVNDIDAYDGPVIIPSLTTTNVPPLYPTPKDYEAGVFTRYFKKKRNEYLFDELDKDQYNSVNTTLYISFQIQWQLVGDRTATYTVNKNMVLLAEQRSNVYGLQSFLKEDYLKYYK
jgi:hypothetical protein